MDNVTWQDAKVFAARMNALDKEALRFRLPTEAEWEYACRSGGKAERFSGGNEQERLGWVAGNSGGAFHAARLKDSPS